jgi:hypothetical protein
LAGAQAPSDSLESRVGPDRRITWRGDAQESIRSFTSSVRPTDVPADIADWIQVCNHTPGTEEYGKHGSDGFKRSAYDDYLRSTQHDATQRKEGILRTAKAQGYTCGKWMLFIPRSQIDEKWARIAQATARGELGNSAKVSTTNFSGGKFLVCVYTHDFSDEPLVRRLLSSLLGLGLSCDLGSHGFKPDVFTELRIYSKNAWHLPTSIYKEMLLRDNGRRGGRGKGKGGGRAGGSACTSTPTASANVKGMPRAESQQLCKQLGIRANSKSAILREALEARREGWQAGPASQGKRNEQRAECLYGRGCTNKSCPQAHSGGRNIDQPCRFGRRCTRQNCAYEHPDGRESTSRIAH